MMEMEDEKNICKSLNKTPKNLNCIILNISKKKIDYQINFIDYIRVCKIDCSHNKIESLDNVIPESVFDLNCSYNKIRLLDNLPPQLRVLDCSHNQITKLDFLPSGLVKLDCSHNQIILLDDLPNGIEFLFCNDNNIQSLNCLPHNIKYLYCYNNKKNLDISNLPTRIEKILN